MELLNTFEKFLQNCGPYDLVVDFENLKHIVKYRWNPTSKFLYLIRNYNIRGILLIGEFVFHIPWYTLYSLYSF